MFQLPADLFQKNRLKTFCLRHFSKLTNQLKQAPISLDHLHSELRRYLGLSFIQHRNFLGLKKSRRWDLLSWGWFDLNNTAHYLHASGIALLQPLSCSYGDLLDNSVGFRYLPLEKLLFSSVHRQGTRQIGRFLNHQVHCKFPEGLEPLSLLGWAIWRLISLFPSWDLGHFLSPQCLKLALFFLERIEDPRSSNW